ncbi:MAG: hypothetical protein V4516_11710 [Pseudomonadota bacterium]
MRYRVMVAGVWWTEAACLTEARAVAMREAGALAQSLGWAVEARVTDAAGAFAGAALGRVTGDADWLPFGSARARAA